MAKKSKKPLDILSEKQDRLDWHKFNFLENLFVFRLCKDKSVPAESGVKFRVTPKDGKQAICLLFRIDKRQDSLFDNNEIRPDYMVLYVRRDLCLCTIIEMKGRQAKDLVHGIEQIKALRDRLRAEIRDSLKTSFKIKFQAILLTQFNADIPRIRIAEEDKKGLTILPLQYNNRAELFNYVSRLNKTTEKYAHEEISRSAEMMFVENILTNYALPEHLQDKFHSANKAKVGNKDGIYINYAFPNCEDYSALAIDNSELKIGFKEEKRKHQNLIEADLKTLGLKTPQHYEFEKIN